MRREHRRRWGRLAELAAELVVLLTAALGYALLAQRLGWWPE